MTKYDPAAARLNALLDEKFAEIEKTAVDNALGSLADGILDGADAVQYFQEIAVIRRLKTKLRLSSVGPE